MGGRKQSRGNPPGGEAAGARCRALDPQLLLQLSSCVGETLTWRAGGEDDAAGRQGETGAPMVVGQARPQALAREETPGPRARGCAPRVAPSGTASSTSCALCVVRRCEESRRARRRNAWIQTEDFHGRIQRHSTRSGPKLRAAPRAASDALCRAEGKPSPGRRRRRAARPAPGCGRRRRPRT